MGGAAALVFDEEIEWTIVDVSDAMFDVGVDWASRERWEDRGTAGG